MPLRGSIVLRLRKRAQLTHYEGAEVDLVQARCDEIGAGGVQ